MAKIYMTKVFTNGGSQAVRVPAELRFELPEIYIWLDEKTGDLRMNNVRPSRMSSFYKSQEKLLPQITDSEWDEWDEMMKEIRANGNQSVRPDYFADEN